MADEAEAWVSAAGALKLVSAVTGSFQAPHAICSRAYDGLIEARAARLILDDRSRDNVDVPRQFWWAKGEAALEQNWVTGDFATWIDHRHHVRAYGVSFSRGGIEALIAPAVASNARPDPPGGRPKAAFWDGLWIEICRQLYTGELQPKKQADLESAMMDWIAKQGHDASEGTIRPRARKLWTALQKEG